ncbi:N-acetylmuramoyl-L-alanine amidase [Aureimonas jatrophae]|uniref:N-acetylmuramoyl-L-alanine amidase n=2 Tax=Aureimonas jatrophae TaxID=1166073 RepID=A0A1H0MDZ0_9HYPH|nr:N-acetylmuramoyl-L-alanine amidase [Aureimonas jatrophae]
MFVLFFVLVAATNAQETTPTVVTAVRLNGDGGQAILEVDTRGPARPHLTLLRKPYRIALDLADTVSAAKLPEPTGRIVNSLRQGLAGADRYRLLLSLSDSVRPRMEVQRDGDRATVKLELAPAPESAFVWSDGGKAPTVQAAVPPLVAPRRFTVVIDAGHGGVDRGATGEGGTEEKAINLAFAMALREVLGAEKDVTTILTRTDDTFIPLNERSAIARRAHADLFISLHADSIRYKDLRGATVYTLSDRASDALSSEIAESENAADRFAGSEWDQDAPEIHDILVDLVRRETENLTERFATHLVDDMRKAGVRLINNPKRSAGFRVLRAPDVPSVLLEIGYLSNKDEEKLLLSSDWQRRFAEILAKAVTDSLRERRG